MKTISLKLEQVKKGKTGETLVNLRTRALQFEDKHKAVEIALLQAFGIRKSLDVAEQMGAKSVKVGDANFSLKGKFTLYVTIDGTDYSIDDALNSEGVLFDGVSWKTGFNNTEALTKGIFAVLRFAEGKSVILSERENKFLTSGLKAQKLIG